MDTTGSGDAQCLLVTGGFGFVMSHVVKAWLGGGHGKCIVLDLPGRLDEAVRVFLGPAAVAANANAAAEGGDGGDAAGNAAEGVGGGGSSSDGLLHYVAGSVTDAGAWARVGALGVRVTHIVHAAAVTPTAAEEVSFPARVLEVNLLGSVAALDFARSLPGGQLRRFIYTSSDGVFNAPGLARGYPPAAAAAAAAAPAASSLYPISKYAMEKVVERYAELFPAALGGGALLTVRFSDVWGPMDRDTGARNRHNEPHRVMRAVLDGARPVCYRGELDDVVADSVYAPDVASAMLLLLLAPPQSRPRQALYNITMGGCPTLRQFLGAMGAAVLEGAVPAADDAVPDMSTLPADHHLRMEPYNLPSAPLEEEFGWKRTPLPEACAQYLAWVRETNIA